MKAIAVFPQTRTLALIDQPEPVLESPRHVKLRVLDVGICGTDREIAEFKYGTPPVSSDHLIIGHECLAQVLEAGAEVRQLHPGDLAVPIVRRPCTRPDCQPCRAGRPDFCITGEFTECGIKGHHGFMCETIVIEERYLVPVPQGLREIAVLTEPLSIAEKAIAQVWQMQDRLPWIASFEKKHLPLEGYHAVVLGAGPIGLLGALLLVRAGFETTVFSREDASTLNAQLVQAIGATYVSSQAEPAEDLVRKAGNIDLMYEATGVSTFSFAMMPYLGRNGIYIFTGIPGVNASIEVDTDAFMKNLVLKNQVIFGTVNADKAAYKTAVSDLADFFERWPHAVKSIITMRAHPEDAAGILTGSSHGIKKVITFASPTEHESHHSSFS